MLAILSPSLVSWRAPDEVRCTYSHIEVCSEKGCTNVPVRDSYLVAPSLKTLEGALVSNDEESARLQVRRCDARGCTPIDVSLSRDGIYLNAAAPEREYMLKLTTLDAPALGVRRGDFVEVASLFLSVYVWHGHCPTGT
jgi:hypothetical protein